MGKLRVELWVGEVASGRLTPKKTLLFLWVSKVGLQVDVNENLQQHGSKKGWKTKVCQKDWRCEHRYFFQSVASPSLNFKCLSHVSHISKTHVPTLLAFDYKYNLHIFLMSSSYCFRQSSTSQHSWVCEIYGKGKNHLNFLKFPALFRVNISCLISCYYDKECTPSAQMWILETN